MIVHTNHKEPSGFFTKSTGDLYGEEEGLMAPTSNSFSIFHLTNNFSYRLWWYSPFYTDSVPGSSGIKCISPSFLFGGTYFGSYPEYTSCYLFSKSRSGLWCFWVTPSKYCTAPSGRSLSLYKTTWKNNIGLLDIFSCTSYFTVLPCHILPSRL